MIRGIKKGIITVLIAVLIMNMCAPFMVRAAQKKVIKVGYFNVGGYFTLDENGEVQGYEKEYLDEISKHTNYDFEYVECGTWMNAVSMLEKKEIDLVGATQWSQDRKNKYEFCAENYGITIGEIVVLPEKKIVYEDYQSIDKMTIGCLYNYIQLDEMLEHLKEKQANPKIETFQTQSELIDALANGKVDAIASYSHIMNQEWPVIEKYSYSPFYFISWKGNTELTEQIDKAIIEIHLKNSEFDDQLIKKMFPTINQNSLTKEEVDYLSNIDSLNFCFCTNEGYLCRTEEGKYVGIHPAIAKEVCERLGITYNEVQFDFPELIRSLSGIRDGKQSASELVDKVKAMGIDVWGDFYSDQSWADTLGVGMSEPYLDATYYQIKRRGTSIEPENCKIAAVRGLRYTTDITSDYEENRIVWCDDFKSCVKAVEDGAADITVINTYAAEYYLAMYQYDNLNATLIDLTNQSSMATVDDPEGLLSSILSKTIQSISKEEMDKLIQNETAILPHQNMIAVFFYAHTFVAVISLGIAMAIIALLIAMVYIARKKQKQNELLIKATNAKSEFLAKMSHDIRTPMNAIINLTDLVEQEIDDKELALKDIQKIKNSNEFLLSLMNDILDMSKIEEGKMVLQRQLYIDTEFIEYLHTIFDEPCRKKNIEFKIDVEVCKIKVYTDRARFNQLCFNLVSNAVKYTPDNGHVTFQMKYEPLTNGHLPVDICVIDDGIGMSREFVSKSFTSFEQENRQFMSVEGAGLGLSIVKQIVELMHGTIRIESEIDHGTKVYVHLDLELADQRETLQDKTEDKEDAFDVQKLKGKKVLLVEDHPLNQQIVVRLLEKVGVSVLVAGNGQEGVELFKKECETINLILMDIRMPVMNGLEATEKIRKLDCKNAENVAIIALTANAYEEDVQKSLDAGMNAHMAKPIEPQMLYQLIAKYF